MEEIRAVQANHRAMVKLKGRQDPGYKRLCSSYRTNPAAALFPAPSVASLAPRRNPVHVALINPSIAGSYKFGQPAHFDWQKQIHEAKPFVQRDSLLQRASSRESDQVTSQTRVTKRVAMIGMGGVGKTADRAAASKHLRKEPVSNGILDRFLLHRLGAGRL